MIKLRLTLTMLLLACCCAAPATLKAQVMEQANKHFTNYEYAQAAEAYQNAYRNGQSSLLVVQRLADSYRMLNNSQEAEQWYAKVVEYPNAAPINTYYYAQAAMQNGKYDKAKKLFMEYAQKAPEQAALAKRMAAATDTAVAWMNTPGPYAVQKVESLNSSAADYSPVKGQDGIFFSSNRSGTQSELAQNNFVKMYHAARTANNTWATPVLLGAAINTTYHNGPATFSEANQTLYFTRAQINRQSTRKSISDPTSWLRGKVVNNPHTNYHGIYMAERKGEEWVNVKPFKYNNTKEYSIGHPAVTADGSVLYFVSDMPGGLGDTDIYYSERQADGTWGAPVNAGSTINTAGRESFPTVGADGNLYFSSTGHIGMGGLDIFKAVGSHKAWARVENMRAPINSSNDDFGLMMDETGKSGLFSSARSGDASSDDIYSFKYKEVKPLVLKGKVIAKAEQDGARIPVDNVLLQLTEQDSNTQEEVYSDEQGNFLFKVQPGKTYTLRGSKEDYLAQTMTVEADLITDTSSIEILLERDTPNVPVALRNIYYDLDKAVLRPEAVEELNKLIRMMNDNPEIKIQLSSHTDSRGHRKYNRLLSERRAQSVVDYLTSNGIDKSRVTAKGYGEKYLINECNDRMRMSCSEEMHQQNRRTEFKIIE